jgi:hypothetical protein
MPDLPYLSIPTRSASKSLGGCRWCGAYGNSQHPSICEPGRLPVLGVSRQAAQDRHLSRLVLLYQQQQDAHVRDL